MAPEVGLDCAAMAASKGGYELAVAAGSSSASGPTQKRSCPARRPIELQCSDICAKRQRISACPSDCSAQGGNHYAFVQGRGREYNKHFAYRRDNDLIDTQGNFVMSTALQAFELPHMSARMHDLLHIAWLILEQLGTNPEEVNQVWLLDQTLWRGPGKHSFPLGFFRDRMPGMPGFHKLGKHGKHGSAACVPCLTPASRAWVNRERRFLLGEECLQFQGVHASVLHVPDVLARRIAGEMYTIPVVGWYVCLAITAVVGRHCMPAPPSMAAAAVGNRKTHGSHTLLPERSAELWLDMLLQAWPTAFDNCRSPAYVHVGSICSGADVAKVYASAIGVQICRRLGMNKVSLIDAFDCEIDKQVMEARRQAMPASHRHYSDIHKLPLGDMQDVDICLISTSCKSLSFQNYDRRSLLDVNVHDSKCQSGAHMQSALQYVKTKLPKVVIFENVLGMLCKPMGSKLRNVDIVLEKLREWGYTCDYDRQDARHWWTPQTRGRIYIWGYRLQVGYGHCSEAFDNPQLRCLQPGFRLHISDCLLSGESK